MSRTSMEKPDLELTESEAIRRAQEGDPAAFECLYRKHSKRVYGLCLRMLKNAGDAEDLTQQVFLVLFRKIGTFRGDSCLSTWLHRVAVNAVLMHLRRRRPTETLAESWDPTRADGHDPREAGPRYASAPEAVDRLNLMRAIRQLPAGYRRLFLLHDVMGYVHGEIAELLGCSIGCSKSQVHKARRRLRQLMGSRQPPAVHRGAAGEAATTGIGLQEDPDVTPPFVHPANFDSQHGQDPVQTMNLVPKLG